MILNNRDYEAVVKYIKGRTGLILAESNVNQVRRFVEKKLSNDIVVSDYIKKLDSNIDEFYDIIEVYTINETYFFREEKYFKLLKEIILPEYLCSRTTLPIVWSSAASSGEEAVSLALLINNLWGIRSRGCSSIIASDIDMKTLGKLKDGLYSKSSLRTDGKCFHDLVLKNSTNNNGYYSINKDIRSMIKIKEINLIKDEYEKILGITPDIVLLCNVLIYMDTDTRNQVIDKMVKILPPGGYLILSSSNTAFVEHPELDLLNHRNCYYFKKRMG